MKISKSMREIENFHIFLWLIKDNAWCHDWHFLGMFMIVPMLAAQAYLTWRSRNDIHEMFHAVAVLLWIIANSIWMTGEFFFNDTWRPVCNWFFGAGLMSMAFYYAIYYRARLNAGVSVD